MLLDNVISRCLYMEFRTESKTTNDLTVIDGNINFDTRLDGDAGDLLHNIRRSVQVNQALVDAHFKAVPSVGTFSTGSLTGGNSQLLGGKTDGSSDMELLVQGGLLQISTDFLQVLHVARSQSDTDAVDNLIGGRGSGLFLWWEGHDVSKDNTSDWKGGRGAQVSRC